MSVRDVHQRRLVKKALAYQERWHYEGGRRDARLDLLRGFAAFAMIADHISGSDSWLAALTGGNRFVVSAAEAFVFISGVVMGIVYLHVVHENGIRAGLVKALHRTGTLYAVTVGLTLAFAALGTILDLWWKPELGAGGIAVFVMEVATLHRTLFLTDIPLMYTLLLLAACPVLWLLWRGRTDVAIALSVGLWAAWQIHPGDVVVPWHIEGNTVFFFPAWQLLFVAGLVAGWHRVEVERWVRHLARPVLFALLGLATVTVAALYVLQVTEIDALRANKLLYKLAFDKANLPAGRLLVFALLAAFSFTAMTVFWDPVKRFTGWLLLPLGQNALTAYSVHVFLVAITTKLSLTLLSARSGTSLSSTSIQIAGIAAVWLIVVYEPRVRLALRRGVSPQTAAARVGGLSPANSIDAIYHEDMRRRPPLPRGGTSTALLSVASLFVFGLLALSGEGGGRGVSSSASIDGPGHVSGPTVIERQIWSDSLGRSMPVTIYLPPGYAANPEARYPVLYMLHGLGGNHFQWQRDGLFGTATLMIQRGDIPPMIIVTPEGEAGYWIDNAGGPYYGSYLALDLVPTIDREYRTNANRAFRAIGGMSMGAHGALQLALNNPDEFGIVGAHSLVLRNKDQAFAFFGDASYFAAVDPVTIVRRNPDAARRLRLWIDIGSSDGWESPALAFNRELDQQGVPHIWHLYAGGHTDEYWSYHLPDYLRFYGDAFRAVPAEG
jgi:enterochelin esterase-like enzyme